MPYCQQQALKVMNKSPNITSLPKKFKVIIKFKKNLKLQSDVLLITFQMMEIWVHFFSTPFPPSCSLETFCRNES